MAASSSSSSYSALLRRSKLASYNPQIDQVYTTTSPHLSRQNFGLKRPLPAATTKTSPFVRISQLDSREGRTVFRKATRETSYVKRWSEIGVGLQSEAFSNLGGKKWETCQVQSRFVDDSLAAATSKGGSIKQPQDAGEVPTRTPNFLAMNETEFESYLDQLEGRREEFRQFVAEEQAKLSPNVSVEDFDLYAHAQSNPNDLVRLVERFLRLHSPSSSSSSAPLPQIHPTLALQYATPTPLESALAPPIPGRLLGPSPTNNYTRSGPLSSYKLGSGTELYSSVLSTVSPLNSANTGGLPTTTFYPDASSIRSNLPGRANFRLINPTINPIGYATRQSIVESGLKKSADFRPATAEYEPSLLALRPVALNPVVDTPRSNQSYSSPAMRHPIGSPAYSGSLPPELARQQSGGGKGGKGGVTPQGLASFFGGGSAGAGGNSKDSYRSLGVNQRGPRDLLAGKRKKRSREDQERWAATRENLLSDRQHENRGSRGKKGGNKEGKKEELLNKLQELLGGADK